MGTPISPEPNQERGNQKPMWLKRQVIPRNDGIVNDLSQRLVKCHRDH